MAEAVGRGGAEKNRKIFRFWFDKSEKCAKLHFHASPFERELFGRGGAEKSLKKFEKSI